MIATLIALGLSAEVLPSWDGTGKVGARIAVDQHIAGPLEIQAGMAYMPKAGIVDLTPALRLGDPGKLWGLFGVGLAYSSSRTIDTRVEGSNIMAHIEAVVGYGPVYGGWTHYSNGAPWLGTPMPNMGVNLFTIGVRYEWH